MLNKDQYFKIIERFGPLLDQLVWCHFPITGDPVQCRVIREERDRCLLAFDEDADLFGCPSFWLKKKHIIGKVNNG